MVARADVEMVYRLFLHREPEDEAVVVQFMRTRSVEELCRVFLHSDEFKMRFGRWQTPMDWPPIALQSTTDPAALGAMVAHVERVWSALGETDPHWSVLSVPQFRSDAYADNVESFRASGQADLDRLQAFATRAGVDLSRFECCLELGCGVGRVTRWLATRFPTVLATDISAAHLAILRHELSAPGVRPILLAAPDQILTLPPFDAFFSLIVLQHNPPPVMALLLRHILTRLQPGGIGYFQLPTYSLGYAFDAQAYLQAPPNQGEMEMHVLPQSEVFAIAAECGCVMLEVREDGYTGNVYGISNTFFLRKTTHE